MSDEEIKLECLRIADMDVNRAREMFRFVTEGRTPNSSNSDKYGHRAEAAKQEREIGVPVITGALGSAND